MTDTEEELFSNDSLNCDLLLEHFFDDNVSLDSVLKDECDSILYESSKYNSNQYLENPKELETRIYEEYASEDSVQNINRTVNIFEEEIENAKIEKSIDIFGSQESIPRIEIKYEPSGNGKWKRCLSPDMFQSEDEDENKLSTSPDIFGGDTDSEDFSQTVTENFFNIRTSTPKTNYYQPIMPDLNIREDFGIKNKNHSRGVSLISEMEKLVKNLLQNLMEGKELTFHVRHMTMSNFLIENDILSLKTPEEATHRKISLCSQKSKNGFAILMYILAETYHMMLTGTSCTIRELYYQDPELMQDQNHVRLAVRDISSLLSATPWELGFRSSSKGLIAGSLVITLENDEILDCSDSTGGILLPHETTKIKSLYSRAELVILVEKDTVYRKLVNLDIFARLGKEIILITGKGYPDINTRIIVNKIYNDLKLPIFALIDADPFGIDILLVYRYGSQAMAHNSAYLACPQIRWIGVYPSEILPLQLSNLPLTSVDNRKITNLLNKSYITAELRNELLVMQKIGKKAELEALSSSLTAFFIDEYIPTKINLNFSQNNHH